MKTLQIYITAFNRPKSLKRLIENLRSTFTSNSISINLAVCLDEGYSREMDEVVDSVNWDKGELTTQKSQTRLGAKGQLLKVLKFSESNEFNLILEDDHFLSPAAEAFVNFAMEQLTKVGWVSLHHFELHPITGFPFIPLESDSDFYFAQRASTRGFMISSNQAKKFNQWLDQYDPQEFDHNVPSYLEGYTDKIGQTLLAKFLIDTNMFLLFPNRSVLTVYGDKGENYRGSFDRFDAQSVLSFSKSNYVLPIEDVIIIFYAWMELHPDSIGHLIPSLKELNVEFDLHGSKTHFSKPIVLTNKVITNPMATFGLDLKPLEMNILFANEGDFFMLGEAKKARDLTWLERVKKELVIRWYYNMRYSLKELIVHLFLRPFQNFHFDLTDKK